MQKIKFVQLDPFGYCNAKCWFCPVKYLPQPEEGSNAMGLDLLEKILFDLYTEKRKVDGVVDKNFNLLTLSHYNEILLYKNFDKLLELLRKYSFKCYVLSNGVPLSKFKTDLISEFKDVVIHVGLNVPAFEKEIWAKRSGFSEETFDRLIENIKYAENKLSYLGNEFKISINGLNSDVINQGYVSLGEKFNNEKYNLNPVNGEHEKQFKIAKQMFPKIDISKSMIFDRTGLIDDILTNKPWLDELSKNKKVVGCNNSGDRSKEWLNINSSGSVFLCCNDYNFDYKFGNLKTQSIREVWLSDERKKMLTRAYQEICTNCIFAQFN
jgi:radical SAM protein with 4Fe4S-binding SPASM domain